MASSNNQQAVLYRKWRPQKFDDLVGQKPIVKTLQNSISTNQISHAYLFSGPRGTGKTTAGRIFAATVNCKNENNDCVDSFFDGSAMSLIELDAASNRGIDEIRNLKENIAYMVGTNQYKVYLIDEVHMLTDAAFNALLKTLEEPPSHVIFILATTEPHKIPATVLSRCQRYDFKKINNADASLRLIEIAKAESILITDEAIAFIARLSTGSLRDSINMLEQVSILIDDEINIENIMPALGVHIDNRCVPLLENMIKKDLSACLSIILELYNDGIDFKSFKNQIIETLRSALYSWNDNDLIEESFLKDNDLEILKIVCKNNIDEITILMKKISLINFSFDNFHPFPLEILVADLCSNNLNNISNSIPPEPTPVSEAPPEPTPVSEAPPEPTPVSEAPPETTILNNELLDIVRSKWSEIKLEARNSNNKAGALMNSGCFVKNIIDDKVIIGFKFKTHVELVKNADNGKILLSIENAVCKVLNKKLSVEAELSEIKDENDNVSNVSNVSNINNKENDLINEALKRGAKIVE